MAEIIFNKVPGMTEPVEQKMLHGLSKVIQLKSNELIYEFGPFMGRSTFYLALGLSENQSKSDQHQIHTFDYFQCSKEGIFAPHVQKHAEAYSVSDLIEERDGIIDFSKVFEHYMEHYISGGSVKMHKKSLKDSYPLPNKKIALMHVDSPKKYSDFRDILLRFFPLLRKGSIVVFQDFFYHWSGSLISAVQLLVEMGIVEMSFSAASSLVVIVLDEPDENQIKEIDQRMATSDLPSIIDQAIESTNTIKVDRRENFQPRLHLAKIQLLAEKGEFEKASGIFNQLLINNKFNAVLLHNFSEMLGQNFKLV